MSFIFLGCLLISHSVHTVELSIVNIPISQMENTEAWRKTCFFFFINSCWGDTKYVPGLGTNWFMSLPLSGFCAQMVTARGAAQAKPGERGQGPGNLSCLTRDKGALISRLFHKPRNSIQTYRQADYLLGRCTVGPETYYLLMNSGFAWLHQQVS